jgi:uncharacterized metal-binding protein
MPSGKTHDGITILLAVPVFSVAYVSTWNSLISTVVTGCFLFGGLMFGPDLDTKSKQYSRWWMFKSLWFPYRMFFKHRSRWSHGLMFGTLIRVVYFTGVISLGGFLAAFVIEVFFGTKITGLEDFFLIWQRIGRTFGQHIGGGLAAAAFLGLWLGAAAHTFADIAGTYIKTGRAKGFL